MMKLILFAILITTAFSTPFARSKAPQLGDRLVGGTPTAIQNFPYQLSLQSAGNHICGASIISPNAVLTAAHCIDGSAASSLSVLAGTSDYTANGRVIIASEVIGHPQFDPVTMDFDIAVLILSENLTFDASIQPIALPDENQEVAAGSPAVVTGWGDTSEGGPQLTQLHEATVEIISLDACKENQGQDAITDRMLCAGAAGDGNAMCQTDAGGPLVSDGKQVGIISWGFGCGQSDDQVGVYADVASLRDFIETVANV